MSVALVGRAIATVGIVVGLVAIGFPLVTVQGFSTRYVDDGTVFAFLVVVLSLTSHFPAEIGRDMSAAALGSAAFGFYLFVPAVLAFDNLGSLGAGGWLGVCTVLIPVGALVVRSAEARHAEPGGPPPAAGNPAVVAAFGGLILIVIGIWLPVTGGGESYWSGSHTLGVLMLLLVALDAVLIGATLYSATAAADLALLAAATTFGLAEYELINRAFEEFGRMGSGAWIQALGGVFLVLGVAAVRRKAAEPAQDASTAATPA
jgi:hypothetical protein